MIKRICITAIILFCFYLCFPVTLFAAEKTTPSGIPISELEAFVDDYVSDYIEDSVAGAAIVAIKDNEIVLSKGYGYADIENQVQMDSSTSILEWGSITKLFVWVSAMQLAEQGQLDLEADIRTFLPADMLTKLNFDEPITMLNLMHHNAGFEENIFDLLIDSPEQIVSLEEALKLAEPEQVYKPGEVVAYSNFSTSLAAYIIEQITEISFYDYIDEHILQELAMQHSTIHLLEEDDQEIISNKTEGYFLNNPGDFIVSEPFYMSLYPSGGMNGTAEDLAKFAQALLQNEAGGPRLFQDEETLTALLSTSYAAAENVPGIAHGFWEYDGQYRGLTHSGNTVAFSSNMQIVPEENFSIIILTNQADETNLTFGLIDALVGEGNHTIQENNPSASEVEGSYLTARRPYNGFMNVYYYLMPLDVRAIGENEIEMDLAGFKADYVQTSPYTYKLKDGDNVFLPSNVMYFHVNDGKVEQISTTYADYLPNDKSKPFLLLSLGIFIWCMAYFLISPLVLALQAILRRRREEKAMAVSRWHGLLILSGTALAVNIVILAIRMLTNSMRTYSEIALHFTGNYIFTGLSFITFIMLMIYWKKSHVSKKQSIGYLLTSISSVLWIGWLIIWKFYA